MTGEELLREMKVRGLSQAALARAVEIDVTKINKVVKNKRQLRISELNRINALFDRIDAGIVNDDSNARVANLPFAPNAFGRQDLHLSGRTIPVYGQVIGGLDGQFLFNGTQVAEVVCLPTLEKVPGAYAVFVSGESMAPRFFPGETVYVHPNYPPRRGSDVVVQLKPEVEGDPPEGFIKKFVSRNGDFLVLEQYNPPQTIRIPADRVVSVHVIMGTSG